MMRRCSHVSGLGKAAECAALQTLPEAGSMPGNARNVWSAVYSTALPWNLLAFTITLTVAGLLATGCGTFEKQKAEKFASVKIHAISEREIRVAIGDVFRDHGFKVTQTKTNVICEKEGSSADNVMFGNWMGEEPVWVRVKLTVLSFGEDRYRLQCLAYKVRDKGSMAFEEEVQVSGMGSHGYQKLLNEVADRFKGNEKAQ